MEWSSISEIWKINSFLFFLFFVFLLFILSFIWFYFSLTFFTCYFAYYTLIDIFPTLKTVTNLKQGYIDIPDTSWTWPEKKEVLVPGNSVEEVELYLNIPDKEEYYNQKYQAVIEVKNKKNRPEEIFVLAYQLRICFSTYASDEGEGSEE